MAKIPIVAIPFVWPCLPLFSNKSDRSTILQSLNEAITQILSKRKSKQTVKTIEIRLVLHM